MDNADPCEDGVVLREQPGAGWRLEFKHEDDGGRLFTAVVAEKEEGVKLAARMCPGIPLQIIPAG